MPEGKLRPESPSDSQFQELANTMELQPTDRGRQRFNWRESVSLGILFAGCFTGANILAYPLHDKSLYVPIAAVGVVATLALAYWVGRRGSVTNRSRTSCL